MGLGNPGPRYDDTRHNVGWWVIDRLAYDWDLGSFDKRGQALTTEGVVGGHEVCLMKPVTYMNRSGAALAPYRTADDFCLETDLLVVVDDANLDVGRVRFRPGGSAGGHKGLESITGVLGAADYARLRIGVGANPAGTDLADWVLSPMDDRDETEVVTLLPELSDAIRRWMDQGIERVMSAFNR